MSRANKAFQVYPILIEEQTLTLAAAAAKRTVNLKEKLPNFIRDKVAHCIGLLAELDLDPTFTTAPTIVGMANALKSIVIRADGGRIMVDAQGPDLRAMEAYENGGRLVSPDPDLNSASTNNFYDARTIDFGPGNFLGNPSDFAIPCCLLKTGVLEPSAPALTDISADTTAGTVVQRVYALCIGLDSIRIPPKMELKTFNASGSTLELGERALYTSILALNSSANDAIAAGDFDTFTLDDRKGNVFSGVPAEVLGRAYNVQNAVGQFGIIQGEPRTATDDNLKVVNGATPTALVSPSAAYQPVVWSPPGSRITTVEVEGPLRLKWSGSQSTGYFAVRRILPRGEKEATELAIIAFEELKVKFASGKVKTLSKQAFGRPGRVEYMPWDFRYVK